MIDICKYDKTTEEVLNILHKQFRHSRGITNTQCLQPIIAVTSEVLAAEFYDNTPDDEDGATIDMRNNRVALYGTDARREGLRQLLSAEVSLRIND